MSFTRPATRRLGLLCAATVAALVPVVGAVPAAVAAPAASVPLHISYSKPSPDAPLTRGYSTSTIDLAVANTGSTAQKYTGLLEVSAVGPRGLDTKKVAVDVRSLNAPSAPARVSTSDHGTVEAEFSPLHSAISVPAHTIYHWRITLGATPSFPRLDTGMHLVTSGAQDSVQVAPDEQEGTVTDTVSGLSETSPSLVPGRPVPFSLSVTGDADSRFTHTLSSTVSLYPPVDPYLRPSVRLQLLDNGQWTDLPTADGPYNWTLPAVPAGLATGDVHTYQLRYVEDAASEPRAGDWQANFSAFTYQDSANRPLVGRADSSIVLGSTGD
jgi:hypothetical protein